MRHLPFVGRSEDEDGRNLLDQLRQKERDLFVDRLPFARLRSEFGRQ